MESHSSFVTAIAYCGSDAKLTQKLLRWIGFLSEKNGGSMKSETLLMVCDKRYDKHSELLGLKSAASAAFGNVILKVPDKEGPTGWPQGPNFVFAQALDEIEKLDADMLWLEPDAVPVRPNWYEAVKREFYECGKPFMGPRSVVLKPHMNGVACYSKKWREHAPSLAEASDVAWDIHAAEEVLKNFRDSALFHNVPRGQSIPGLLDDQVAVYHPDKTGDLIQKIDFENFGGEFSVDMTKSIRKRFFKCYNAARSFVHDRGAFAWVICGRSPSGVFGVRMSIDQEEQEALELQTKLGPGIEEIEESEYYRLSEKKRTYKTTDFIDFGRPLASHRQRRPVGQDPEDAVAAQGGVQVPTYAGEPPSMKDAIRVEKVEQ